MTDFKWHSFDTKKGYRQKRPPIKKPVLVQMKNLDPVFPDPICLAYRKNAAGCADSPYFVTFGMSGTFGEVYRWCDCLPAGFKMPKKRFNGAWRD